MIENKINENSMGVHYSSKTNEWYTPLSVYNPLHEEFKFTLDPCCTPESSKCDKYFTKEDDGLIQRWNGEVVFINPPYGRDIKHWVKKVYDESNNGAICVMLIPSRTDTSYWHDYIFNKAEIRFMRGRIKF